METKFHTFLTSAVLDRDGSKENVPSQTPNGLNEIMHNKYGRLFVWHFCSYNFIAITLVKDVF